MCVARLLLVAAVVTAFKPTPSASANPPSHCTITTTTPWSSALLAACRGADASTAVEVAEGARLTLDVSMDVKALRVHGTFAWDTTKPSLVLRTGRAQVSGTSALFNLGSEAQPMVLPATIYIDSARDGDVTQHDAGSRALQGTNGAQINIHGKQTYMCSADT